MSKRLSSSRRSLRTNIETLEVRRLLSGKGGDDALEQAVAEVVVPIIVTIDNPAAPDSAPVMSDEVSALPEQEPTREDNSGSAGDGVAITVEQEDERSGKGKGRDKDKGDDKDKDGAEPAGSTDNSGAGGEEIVLVVDATPLPEVTPIPVTDSSGPGPDGGDVVVVDDSGGGSVVIIDEVVTDDTSGGGGLVDSDNSDNGNGNGNSGNGNGNSGNNGNSGSEVVDNSGSGGGSVIDPGGLVGGEVVDSGTTDTGTDAGNGNTGGSDVVTVVDSVPPPVVVDAGEVVVVLPPPEVIDTGVVGGEIVGGDVVVLPPPEVIDTGVVGGEIVGGDVVVLPPPEVIDTGVVGGEIVDGTGGESVVVLPPPDAIDVGEVVGEIGGDIGGVIDGVVGGVDVTPPGIFDGGEIIVGDTDDSGMGGDLGTGGSVTPGELGGGDIFTGVADVDFDNVPVIPTPYLSTPTDGIATNQQPVTEVLGTPASTSSTPQTFSDSAITSSTTAIAGETRTIARDSVAEVKEDTTTSTSSADTGDTDGAVDPRLAAASAAAAPSEDIDQLTEVQTVAELGDGQIIEDGDPDGLASELDDRRFGPVSGWAESIFAKRRTISRAMVRVETLSAMVVTDPEEAQAAAGAAAGEAVAAAAAVEPVGEEQEVQPQRALASFSTYQPESANVHNIMAAALAGTTFLAIHWHRWRKRRMEAASAAASKLASLLRFDPLAAWLDDGRNRRD